MNSGFAFLRLPWVISAFLCTGLLLLSGCAKGGTGTVTGTVTYKGKPLPGGFIIFVAEQGNSVARGNIQKDGSYRVEKAPVGNVKIGVQALGLLKYPTKAAEMAKKPAAVKPSKSVKVPKQFEDPSKSGLTYTVKRSPQEYNISLK